MAPIKFEDSIKEKLEERRLQPSATAWDSLSDRLDTQDSGNGKSRFWWLAIAASFVGILIISSMFFNRDIENEVEPIVVDIEEPVIQVEDNTIDQSVVEDILEGDIVLDSDKKKDKKPTVTEQQLKQKQDALIKGKIRDVVAQAEISKNEVSQEKVIDKALSLEDIKLQEVVDRINELKKSDAGVTNAEIDSLLDRAQKEISLQKIFNKSTKTVDADALLREVEDDLEQSFRARVFEALRTGYVGVRTAVAERNN